MGIDVTFSGGLKLTPTVKTLKDVEKLMYPDVETELGYVRDTIKCVRDQVGSTKAVLGFSGAPYTLACYMVEGAGSRHYHMIKSLMFTEPDTFHALMKRVTPIVVDYLAMQIRAGVTAVQLFDSWAGELTPEDFSRFVLPYVREIIEKIRPLGTPVIYYINGIGNLMDRISKTGADVVGIDWRISLTRARQILGTRTVLQGNLDPGALFGPPEFIRDRVFEMLDQTGGLGHIVNLGHGVIPQTPLRGIETFIRCVAEWADQNRPKNGVGDFNGN